MADQKTVIVTGASHGIGAAITHAFLDRSYRVVATARSFASSGFAPSPGLALVEGDIGQASTAENVTQTAIRQFGSIDHVVNDAGIYFSKPFTDYTIDDFRRFVSINLEGFIFITQLAVRQMLAQGRGGSVTTISASLAGNPIAGSPASIAMMTKGALNTATLSLANEYARQKIRFNAVAPGVVESPLHKDEPADLLAARSPMGTITAPSDIASAVVYLTEASHITGQVLYVDDGAHAGKW